MTDEEERLRRIVREEIAAFFGAGWRPVRRKVDPTLSAKRSAAAKAMWAKVKGEIPTALPTAPITKPRASKSRAAKPPVETVASMQPASNELALEYANGGNGEQQPPTAKAFNAYAGAYRMRYGEFPVRNAKTNALLKQLVTRLGRDEAAPVSEYYLSLADKLYAGSGHCLSLLVRDAEKLRTMWKQGATIAPGAPAAPAKPWWEVWSLLEQQGDELGIDRDLDHPQGYRSAVLRAAYVAGRLPEEAALKLGMRVDTGPDQGII